MKTKKILYINVIALTTLLVGVFVLQSFAPGTVTAYVMFDPDTFDLGAPAWGRNVKEVLVTVWFDKGKLKADDIDAKTVLVDGVLEPKGGWKHTWVERIKIDRKSVLVFRFNIAGGAFKDHLWTKVTHEMLGGSATMQLEVTGNLYDGTPFAGTGDVYVLIPTTPPIPPPPPPEP